MKMIRDQSPGVTGSLLIGQDIPEPIQKPNPVRIVLKYLFPFDTPDNNVVNSSGCIDSRLSWHFPFLSAHRKVNQEYFNMKMSLIAT